MGKYGSSFASSTCTACASAVGARGRASCPIFVTVKAFGNGAYGALGDGGTSDRNTPRKVASLSGVQAIAAGSGHAVFLHSDGTVSTVGGNSQGQLGLGDFKQRNTPQKVPTLSGAQVLGASGGAQRTWVGTR